MWFSLCEKDYGFYVHRAGQREVFLAIYVNGMLLIGLDKHIEMIVASLANRFAIEDIGKVPYLLWIEMGSSSLPKAARSAKPSTPRGC